MSPQCWVRISCPSNISTSQPKASSDASEKIQRQGTPTESGGLRDLSNFTVLSSFISSKKLLHLLRVDSGNSWSHSTPFCHSRCIPILARTRKAAANPIGSYILAIWLKITLLVMLMSWGTFTLNRKTSSTWFHTYPSIFSSLASSKSLAFWEETPTLLFLKTLFDSHPFTLKFLVPKSLSKSSVTLSAFSKVDTESHISSMYVLSVSTRTPLQ